MSNGYTQNCQPQDCQLVGNSEVGNLMLSQILKPLNCSKRIVGDPLYCRGDCDKHRHNNQKTNNSCRGVGPLIFKWQQVFLIAILLTMFLPSTKSDIEKFFLIDKTTQAETKIIVSNTDSATVPRLLVFQILHNLICPSQILAKYDFHNRQQGCR